MPASACGVLTVLMLSPALGARLPGSTLANPERAEMMSTWQKEPARAVSELPTGSVRVGVWGGGVLQALHIRKLPLPT